MKSAELMIPLNIIFFPFMADVGSSVFYSFLLAFHEFSGVL